MDLLYKFLSAETVYSLGIMLLHFMWQAIILAIALSFFMIITRKSSPVPRYYAAVFSMFLLPVIAFINFIRTKSSIEAALATQNGYIEHIDPITQSSNLLDKFISLYSTYLPLIVLVWFIGITALLLKNLGGLIYLQRIKNYYLEPVSDVIQELVGQIHKKYFVKKTVRPLISLKADTPMVIGHFKPVILIPKHIAETLSSDEIRIILQHEMAHIKRNDFLVNIFQLIVEIIFFFHPVTWWISHIIRHEREECCDAYAAQTGEEKIKLAKVLTTIQENKLKNTIMATTLINKKNGLYNRISNLFGNRPSSPSFREGIIVMLFVFLCVITMAFVSDNNTIPNNEQHSLKTINAQLSNGDYIYAKVDSVGSIKELFVEGKKVKKRKIPYYQTQIDSILDFENSNPHYEVINKTKKLSVNKNQVTEDQIEAGLFNMNVDDKNNKVKMSANTNGFKMNVTDGGSSVIMNFGEDGAFMDITEDGKTTFHMNIGTSGIDLKSLSDEINKEIQKEINEVMDDEDSSMEYVKDNDEENAKILRHAALYDEDEDIRLYAVEKINDQEILKHVAIYDNATKVKLLAIKNLTDQSGLKHVALYDNDPEVRLLAVSKLTDQSGLKHVALYDNDPKVRLLAVSQLTDQSALKHVVSYDSNPDVRKLALKRLK